MKGISGGMVKGISGGMVGGISGGMVKGCGHAGYSCVCSLWRLVESSSM